MPSDFHFLSPEWLLALLPLGVILWRIGRRGTGASAWQQIVDPNLLPHLMVAGGSGGRRLPLLLLAAGWLVAVVALANPTFERLPVPAYRGELSRVVVLDLSRSMEAADLEPSRLARARFKVADTLERSRDGQIGLVAFAGDAFVVSPLTDDADTILSLLDALIPEIMPVQGSRPDLALARATELLTQAGATRGEILLIGDDAGDRRALDQARALKDAGHRLSVIGVGTAEGATVPGLVGANEAPVTLRLDADSMQALARAGGGAYAPLSADGRDLDSTLGTNRFMPDRVPDETEIQTEVWKELGPWILLALLPLGALAFRRGWLLAAVLTIGSNALVPKPALAADWEDLWQRRDQQAAAALERGEHQRALDLADQPRQRGTASYRLGDYDAAAQAFAALNDADSRYNHGNALARSGRLKEAIEAYEQALSQAPDMEDAAHNKALVEELLKRQEQEQQETQQSERQQPQDKPPQDQESSDQSGQGEKPTESEWEKAEADQRESSDPTEEPAGQQQADRQNQESAEGDQAAEQEQEQEDKASREREQGAPAGGSDDEFPKENDPNPDEAQDPEETERAAADYREQAAEQHEGQVQDASADAPEEPSAREREDRQAADQWLRRIPDDPAGLLRRKFRYQYRSRAAREGAAASGNPW